MDESRYLEDLKVIRQVLRENEERALLEWWAFLIWGVLVLSGTLGSWFLAARGVAPMRIFVLLWVPILVIGAGGELLALLKRFNREETPLFTRRFMKLFGTFTLVFIGLATLAVELVQEGISPGLILVIASMPAVFYAYATLSALFFEAAALLVVGVLLELIGGSSEILYLLSGIGTGVTYLVMGFHSKAVEQRRRE